MKTKEKQKNIPKLRFPGFSGEWEDKRLGNIYSFRTTNSYSRENLNHDIGNVKNIHYGDIHTKFKSLFDITKEKVPFINKKISLKKISDDSYCKKGDLVIADASEDYADIGKCIEIINLNGEKVLSGLHTFLARPDLYKMESSFGSYLMKSQQARLQIMTIAQGTKVLSISTGRLVNVKLNIPKAVEQQKIAKFLTVVDGWIENLREQKESFESYKKGMMQRIFSRKIRFPGFSGEWEEKKLGEVCEKESSGISANSLDKNYGKYKIYGANGKLKKVDFYKQDESYISIVKDGAGVGRILICEPKTSVLGTLDVIKPKKYANLHFLYSLLSCIRFTKYITGSTIPHIYFKDYRKEKIQIPKIKEQQKIADFLTSIDNLINSKQQQITKAEKWKKGLMQGLFV